MRWRGNAADGGGSGLEDGSWSPACRGAPVLLKGVLPAGAVFPLDFGFVSSTLGADGDALNVLVLMDEPAFVGCLVSSRLIGVSGAEQREGEETTRNDPLIAAAADCHQHPGVSSLDDVSEALIDEIEHCFISYNAVHGSQFHLSSRLHADRARWLVQEAAEHVGEPKTSSGWSGHGNKETARGR